MRVSGKFVLISLSENDFNGKKYYKVNVEDMDTGKMLVFDADATIVPQVVKYKEFSGVFELNQYERERGRDTKLRLFHLEPVNK